jgi:hypothetical protein
LTEAEVKSLLRPRKEEEKPASTRASSREKSSIKAQ